MTKVVHEGLIYFVDADCYTRMYRVQKLISQDPFKEISLSFHPFENYPFGIESHATAPLDWLLCFLSFLFALFPQSLDLAGLLVGPILAALAGFFLVLATHKLSLGWARWILLGTYLLSPPLIWATTIGRPDHQCLIISFMTIAIACELLRWENPKFHLTAGLAWGISLWVSLWEPLILFGATLIFNLISRKHENTHYLGGVILIVACGLGVDGLPEFSLPLGEKNLIFFNWLSTIGEITGIYWPQLLQLGLPCFILPYLLWKKRKKLPLNKPFFLILTLSLLLLALCFSQSRWLPYTCLSCAFLTALLFKNFNKRKTQRLVLALQFAPLILWNIWEISILKPPTQLAELRHIASEIAPSETQATLGPWWHSPAFLYYSDTPIVASSSHQSLAGTLDAARFFTTDNFLNAQNILRQRQARWVLVSNPDNLFTNSFQILYGERPLMADIPKSPESRLVLLRLWYSQALPKWVRLRAVTNHFRLYEILPE